jgi:methyl-accepting chemotaxis protein
MLAQRCAAAAKETKQLIANSVTKVEAGSIVVDQAGTAMDELVQSIERVNVLMGGIATASIEQHIGIEQVNRAIIQMDETTQRNAALVEEASSAAHSMADQSQSLRHVVSIFKLGTGATDAASAST